MRAGKPYSLMVAITSVLLLAQAAFAASPATELDEVEVVGKKLRTLLAEANAAEDRYYRRFNELNDDDRFDVTCARHKEIGTNVPKRECRAQMYVDTQTAAAEDFFESVKVGNSRSTALRSTWILADIQAEYRKVVADTIARNPELIKLAQDVAVTRKAYQSALHKDKEGKDSR